MELLLLFGHLFASSSNLARPAAPAPTVPAPPSVLVSERQGAAPPPPFLAQFGPKNLLQKPLFFVSFSVGSVIFLYSEKKLLLLNKPN